MFNRWPLLLPIILLSTALSSAANAVALDPMIEGAKQCTRQLPRYEREYGVPVHLLSAISSTESGRWHDGLKITLPWPWTINAEGKGYYFDSKQEAITAVRRLQAQGIKSIDIGCMQVNLMHHPSAFASLDQAFEPENNIAYAASFLRNLYQSEGSWRKAAAAYHSKTPVRGAEYVSRVYDKWYQIIDKVRIARTVVAAADIQAPGSSAVAVTTPKASAVQTASFNPPTRSMLGEQAGKKLQPQKAVHMKVIEVSKAKQKASSNLIVIRPDVPTSSTQTAAKSVFAPKRAEITVADAKTGAVTSAHIIPVKAETTVVQKGGPRFIFND